MTLLEELKQKISQALSVSSVVFSYPPSSDLGDLSVACFELAKNKKISPLQMAAELATELQVVPNLKKYFSEIKALGPYLNFFIDSKYLASELIPKIRQKKEKFGSNHLSHSQRIMVEYSNGNTHKEYHIGHLRNIAYGDAIAKLLAVNGYRVIPVSYINDFGIHTAKTIWNWQRNTVWDSRQEDKGYLLGKCYTEASQILTQHPEFKEEVGAIMKEIESRRGSSYDLWLETRGWSIDYFSSIYKELNIKFKKIFYESEVIFAGLKLVDELTKKGILVRSEGALIANLEEFNLGVLPVIRSDGTALYPVADLALASEKFKEYNLDESIYVIDVRQSLYFKQLFKVLELTGYKPAVFHLSYDFVTLPEGMMASRTGNVITYEDLKNSILRKLTEETQRRHTDWTAIRVNQVALALTIATIKFEMLKVNADKIITFNIEEAAKFEGYTACYLQYGYARLKSIVRKEDWKFCFGQPDLKKLTEILEKDILIKLAKYEEVVKLSGVKYNPSELTKYLFELVQLSNDYYHSVNILKAEEPIRRARLALIKEIGQVIKNGLAILGIEVLEEM